MVGQSGGPEDIDGSMCGSGIVISGLFNYACSLVNSLKEILREVEGYITIIDTTIYIELAIAGGSRSFQVLSTNRPSINFIVAPPATNILIGIPSER